MDLPKKRIRYGLLYGPPTDFTTHIVERARKALGLRHIFAVKSEKSLVNNFNEDHYLAGIYFYNLTKNNNNNSQSEFNGIPSRLDLTISFPSEFRTSKHPEIFPSLWLTRCTGVLDNFDAEHLRHADFYVREGFLQLQHRLFVEWFKMLLNSSETEEESLHGLLPTITVRSFKQRTTDEPCYGAGTSNITWFLYYFTFFVPFLRVIGVRD